jgi:hypothetical protein
MYDADSNLNFKIYIYQVFLKKKLELNISSTSFLGRGQFKIVL